MTEQAKIKFSATEIRDLFGDLAAEDSDSERFDSYFVKLDVYDEIHNFLPLRILVAQKGVGKSAIFKKSLMEDQKNNILAIKITPDDVKDLVEGDDETKPLDLIRQWKSGLNDVILSEVIKKYEISSGSELFKLISNKTLKISSVLSTLSKKVSEIVDTEKVTKLLAQKYIENKKIIIYIDDLDRAWKGTKQNIERISALLNAVRDMSNDNQELCFRISLRSDVFYLVRTADESTDKVTSNVVWMKWKNHELLALLIKRVQLFFGNNLETSQLLNMSQNSLSEYLKDIMDTPFKRQGKWNNKPIRFVLMTLIRNRPRDLINLCTMAAKNARQNKRNKIMSEDWEEITREYSSDRMQDTVNEHIYELPEIERLLLALKPTADEIKNIKTKKPFIYSKQEFLKKIDNAMQAGKFNFSDGRPANSDDLLTFLYKINYIVARKKLDNDYIQRVYFEDSKYITGIRNVDFGYDWEIHPAFRKILYLDSRDIFSLIDIAEEITE